MAEGSVLFFPAAGRRYLHAPWETFSFRNGRCSERSSSATQLSGPQLHSHTRKLSKCQLHYPEHLNYCSRESGALLKSTPFVRAPLFASHTPDQPACFSCHLLTNPSNDLLPCYDGSCLIISITGLRTQQAEKRLTQEEAARFAPTAATPCGSMPINTSPFQLALCEHLDKGSGGDTVAGNIISRCSSEKSSEDDRYRDENKRWVDRGEDAL